MRIQSPKILSSAKGQPCTFRLPGICNYDSTTVVFCHGPDKKRGKATKTSDTWGAFGCSCCHPAMDEKRIAGTEQIWLEAIRETQAILFVKGLLTCPEKVAKPKALKKPSIPTGGGIARQFQGTAQ